MWKYAAILCLLLSACAGVLSAQNYPLPDATVGTPYTFDLLSGVDLSQIEAELQQLGYQLTLSFNVTSGMLPPGITASPNLLSFSGTHTAIGTFIFPPDLPTALFSPSTPLTFLHF